MIIPDMISNDFVSLFEIRTTGYNYLDVSSCDKSVTQ